VAFPINQRKPNTEGGTAFFTRGDIDLSTVVANNPIGNGETQAKTFAFSAAGTRFFCPVKPLEDIRQILSRDTWTVITDRQARPVALFTNTHHHFSAGGCVLDGVSNQVDQHLL